MPTADNQDKRSEFSDPVPLYAVTVNYNSEEDLLGLIASLNAGPFLKRLIIVNHSEPGACRELDADFPIQVIDQENRGYGAGMNRGFREITEPDAAVLICNPDIRIMTPDTMSQALEYLQANPDIGCLIPALRDRESLPVPSCRQFYTLRTLIASRIPGLRSNPSGFLADHFYLDRDETEPFDVDWGSGSAMLFRLSLFPDKVAFDERFFLYFEDLDLCAQIWQAGSRVVRYPKLVCRHYEQKKSHSDLRFLVRHVMSLLKYIQKYKGLPQRTDWAPIE